MIKWKIQFHIEEALEQRRHKATEELSNFGNCREDSHLRDFYDSDEQILLQRAFRRRADRWSKKCAFVDSLLDYVESYPTFRISSVPPPPPALAESIRDVVELDINGNVDAHHSFFNPP